MKDFSGIEFASEHNGTDVFRLIELAYEQGQKDGHSEQLGTNLAEVGTDCISREQAIEAIEDFPHGNTWNVESMEEMVYKIRQLPPIQPKRGRWHYSDGKPARIGLSFGVVCDQCGTESEYCTNFCGECGADMRQREE